jgi:hypothetical protein
VRSRGKIEQLENRHLLTTTLFLDFGAGVGFDDFGQPRALRTSAGEILNIAGPGLNGDGTGPPISNVTEQPQGWVDFRPLSYDWNGDNVLNQEDIDSLSIAVLERVRRSVEPFDIDVRLAAAASLSDAQNSLNANNANVESYDAYAFVTEVVSERWNGGSVGFNELLYGRAALDDLLAVSGNQQDEAAIIFSDREFADVLGAEGTAAFNDMLAGRLAATAIHEAFHTFGFDHTVFTANLDDQLVAVGDIIEPGSDVDIRPQPVVATRFPVLRGFDFSLVDHYLQLAEDQNIGIRDTDDNNKADIAYITGTGANDLIKLTADSTDPDIVHVAIIPFNDAMRTDQSEFYTLSQPASYSYEINLNSAGANTWDNTDGGFLIDSSHGSDRIEIDAAIAGDFRIRTLLGDDEVVIKGSPTPRMRSFLCEGEDGDDKLIFDYTTGDPLPRPGFDFAFDGGEGTDSVEVIELDSQSQPVTRPAYFVFAPIQSDFTQSDVPVVTVGATLTDSATATGDRQTLRSAIVSANAAGQPAFIYLPSTTVNMSVEGMESSGAATNDLDVTGDVTIIGAGAGVTFINGYYDSYTGPSDAKQTFHVSGTTASLELARVTLLGSQTSTSSLHIGGGAILADGGATLLLTESTVVGASDATGSWGVGVASVSANVTIDRSVFTGNSGYGGTAVFAIGTSTTPGSLTIGDSVFALNGASTSYPNVYVAGGVGSLTNNGGNLFDDDSGGFFDVVPDDGDHLGTPTYVVTSVADTYRDTFDPTRLSLREAIRWSNADTQTDEEIWMPAWDFVLTRRSADAAFFDTAFNDLDVLGSLKIQGVTGKTSLSWHPAVLDELFALMGDYNNDGDVDVTDFGAFVDDFNLGYSPSGSGDFESDGDVDIIDFGVFSHGYDALLIVWGVTLA